MLVVFIRTLILFLIVVVVMRAMGKRQIGQLQPFELAVAIMISELAAVPMQNTGIPLINGIIPIITLLVAQLLLSLISLKSVKARGIICGKPNILIENGKIIEANLRKEMYTLNDLLEQLRIKGTSNISDIEYAILETNGQLSIIPKSQKRPITPEDIKIDTQYEGIPLDLVIDGDVNYKNLKRANLDESWLINQLNSLGIRNIKETLFVSLDSAGKLYLQKKSKEGEGH
ncbi:DUF421 domain-containing protein [Pseudobacteroides cellulosolvens]|uniref:YetF C-terminal domain-containing protein n=1 Tax=Pseudobacteroides cellulosolvens ATCC 35603 = DSM 2933 TaxID=398512 RepID=A0A0L6JLT2_9FIRM|nr:DUF421 domain-containing protein [Pseudobacteroides cellulosolvens]KNY26781.1 protein of unknown function DUF421 [Pseudobacteroides cellulosolvens ATCC 35603 = DSM 2933]